jgi:uncharacterized membrane protein
MISSRAPTIVLLLLWVCFAVCVFATANQLPERVATHFNLQGEANGWMTRSTHIIMMSIFGVLFPLFFVGIFWLIGSVPSSMINIPRRDYWLAPERAAETYRYFKRHGLWLACWAVCFAMGIHVVVVLANREAPAHISGTLIWLLAGVFIAGIAAWCVSMMWHFRYGQ